MSYWSSIGSSFGKAGLDLLNQVGNIVAPIDEEDDEHQQNGDNSASDMFEEDDDGAGDDQPSEFLENRSAGAKSTVVAERSLSPVEPGANNSEGPTNWNSESHDGSAPPFASQATASVGQLPGLGIPGRGESTENSGVTDEFHTISLSSTPSSPDRTAPPVAAPHSNGDFNGRGGGLFANSLATSASLLSTYSMANVTSFLGAQLNEYVQADRDIDGQDEQLSVLNTAETISDGESESGTASIAHTPPGSREAVSASEPLPVQASKDELSEVSLNSPKSARLTQQKQIPLKETNGDVPGPADHDDIEMQRAYQALELKLRNTEQAHAAALVDAEALLRECEQSCWQAKAENAELLEYIESLKGEISSKNSTCERLLEQSSTQAQLVKKQAEEGEAHKRRITDLRTELQQTRGQLELSRALVSRLQLQLDDSQPASAAGLDSQLRQDLEKRAQELEMKNQILNIALEEKASIGHHG
jgi:hypothetical protein